jgi:hypothetical protein
MIQVNAVKQGYYQIIEVTPTEEIILDSKASEVEAIQGLINFQLQGKNVIMKPPTYRVDIDGHFEEEIYYTEGYVHLTTQEGVQYIRVKPSMDIIRISRGVARQHQGKFILKRTEGENGIDSYGIFGPQPFEIDNDHEVIDYETGRLRLWATEPWRVEYYVNGILDPASDPSDLPADQYNSTPTEELYRHTRAINATHGDLVEIVGYNAAGESDSFSIKIETLHMLDQKDRIQALNDQISAIMSEPEP